MDEICGKIERNAMESILRQEDARFIELTAVQFPWDGTAPILV